MEPTESYDCVQAEPWRAPDEIIRRAAESDASRSENEEALCEANAGAAEQKNASDETTRREPKSEVSPSELEDPLCEANARAEDFRQRYLYAEADLDNAKKRMLQFATEAERSFKTRLLLKLLPVLDNLERALSHQDSDGLREGLAATLRGFESILESEGVTPILTIGEPFDPQVAEAIATEPKSSVPNDLVIAETQRGYRVNGDMLRPARVIVAKND